MPKSLLPPRGIFIPASILYDTNLKPAARDTYSQLRGLAYGQSETPALSFPQLVELLGKSQSTLYGHMTALRARGVLRWRSSRDGTFIVSFPEFQDSEKLEMLDSLNTSINNNDLINGVKDSEIPKFQKIGKSKSSKEKKEPIPQDVMGPFVNTLAMVTGMDKKLNYGRLAKEAEGLLSGGYTAQQVAKVYGKGGPWFVHDWRGQKGNKPEIGQIKQRIAELWELRDQPPPSKNGSKPDRQNAFRDVTND